MVSNTNIACILFSKCFMPLYIVYLYAYIENIAFFAKKKEKIVLKIYLSCGVALDNKMMPATHKIVGYKVL